MLPDDDRHGTTRGYAAHRRSGQEPCEACRLAMSARDRELRDAKKVPCADCGKPCMGRRCLKCNAIKVSHDAKERRAQVSNDARERRALEPRSAPLVDEMNALDDLDETDSLEYLGGWRLVGGIMRPTASRRAS